VGSAFKNIHKRQVIKLINSSAVRLFLTAHEPTKKTQPLQNFLKYISVSFIFEFQLLRSDSKKAVVDTLKPRLVFFNLSMTTNNWLTVNVIKKMFKFFITPPVTQV